MAESPDRDELYVGYLPQAPPGIARFTRATVAAVIVFAVVAAALLAAAQKPFGPGVFEFGVEHAYEGVLRERPYPTLEVESSDHPEVLVGRRHYLVAQFKHGADPEVAELDGQRVRLRGTLVHRDGQRMIELVPGSVEALGEPDTWSVPKTDSGQLTLIGEIVDSKCYLGVMKPASEKPHRDCAVRCISGGIPPLFLVRSEGGPAAHLLLIGDDGRQLGKEVLDYVAEPLEITGEVVRTGDIYALRAEPSTYRRLE